MKKNRSLHFAELLQERVQPQGDVPALHLQAARSAPRSRELHGGRFHDETVRRPAGLELDRPRGRSQSSPAARVAAQRATLSQDHPLLRPRQVLGEGHTAVQGARRTLRDQALRLRQAQRDTQGAGALPRQHTDPAQARARVL